MQDTLEKREVLVGDVFKHVVDGEERIYKVTGVNIEDYDMDIGVRSVKSKRYIVDLVNISNKDDPKRVEIYTNPTISIMKKNNYIFWHNEKNEIYSQMQEQDKKDSDKERGGKKSKKTKRSKKSTKKSTKKGKKHTRKHKK